MNLYRYLNRITFIFYYLKTQLWYKLFLKTCGSKTVIYKPIYIDPKYISLGKGVFIRNNARLEVVNIGKETAIIIADNVNIEQNIHLTCANLIQIGKNTAIAANVSITDIKHSYEDVTINPKLQPLIADKVIIGEDCTIYNNSVLLPGVILGDRCVVAANSVVLGKVYPPYSVLAGNPARVVKRFDQLTNSWLKNDVTGEFVNDLNSK